jgi:predicted ATPase/DNA-binding SARP family transcriptional activator
MRTTLVNPPVQAKLPDGVALLPVHLTRFIGRTTELGEVSRLLGGTRLLTLTGAGGSGKTRLAREAAAVSTGFERIGWVDLAPIGDAALLPQQVATALQLPDRASASAVESVVTSIGDSHQLLVIDNCEHLVDACAALVEKLLRGCPRLFVLATSREALGIPSETAWLIPPLAGSDAVQLFVERAQAALPSFSATDGNAATLGDICRRLDGIPLAIELAAARVRVLSAEQIAGRLDDAFRLLTTGSRTALPRHRTLRGTMDWSYGLLDHREQQLLRRLSVFAGSFSLDAAEAVCAGAPLEVEDILDGVAALVDKSLVVMEAGDGVARYHLLETVKQYGLELLTASSELAEFRARHGEYFLKLAESIAPLLIGGEHEVGLLARVGPDHDNLRAASAWALNDPDGASRALRFADALFWFWYGMGYRLKSGQIREARQYVDAALTRADGADPLLHGRALLASGLTALAQGDNTRARAAFTASLALVRVHGDDVLRSYVLAKLGAAHLMLGDNAAARDVLDEAYELSRPLPPQMVHAFVLYWRGLAALVRGDIALARTMFEYNAELGRTVSHRTIYAHSASQLGRLLMLEGNHAEGFARISDAIRVHLEIGDAWGLAGDFDGMASLTMARGRVIDTVRLIGAVDVLRERVAIGLPATDQIERDRLLAIGRQELGAAFDGIYAEGRQLTMDQAVELANDAAGMQTAEYRVPVLTPSHSVLVVEDAVPDAASPPTLRVLGLGPLQVFINDEAIDSAAWGSARPRELLMYLLMHPEGCTKEQVGLSFWPEASMAQLRNSFHVTLHRLRKALRNPDWITVANDRYRIDPAVECHFDVASFEREIVAARRALQRKEEGAAAALERALSLYRGDFLDGEPVGDWHIEHRDHLQRLFVDSLMALGVQLTAEERHAKAADVYRRVLARDDLQEDAALALMNAHARLGERAQALRFYQQFVERMRKELDAEPGEELVELYEELKDGSGVR